MNPSLKNQLRSLDRALLGLLDERARLLSSVGQDDPGRRAAIDDMLRRHDGPFPAEGVSETFAAIDRHCSSPAKPPLAKGGDERPDDLASENGRGR